MAGEQVRDISLRGLQVASVGLPGATGPTGDVNPQMPILVAAAEDAAAAADVSALAAQSAQTGAETARGQAQAAQTAAESARDLAQSYQAAAQGAASAAGASEIAAGGARTAAESARDTAAGHATTATTQAGIATTMSADASNSATAAATAKTGAEAARDAAQAGANVYASTAAGLAAVADGGQFMVVVGSEIIRYTRTNSTTATEVARYPTAAKVEGVDASGTYSGYAAAIVDDAGRVALGVTDAGTVVVADLSASAANISTLVAGSVDVAGFLHESVGDPGYAFAITDADGNIALGIKLTGEVVIGSLTAAEANIGVPADTFPYSTEGSKVYALGDSTVAAYLGGTAIMGLISSSRSEVDLSVPGHTINQQKAAWDAQTIVGEDVGWVVVQVGLNDLDPAEAASVAIGRLQTLVNTIKSEIGPRKLLISKMIPCRQRLINIYGATNGPVAYQKWLDINSAIAGFGANAITNVDGRIIEHEPLMNDGAGNLKAIYDAGDGIHPNTAGRQVNATAWENAIKRAGLLV